MTRSPNAPPSASASPGCGISRSTLPYKLGKYYFYTYNTGLQNQPVLFVTEDRKSPGRVLIDPNTLSADGTVALADTRTTRDGRLVAYATSVAGSDWQTWKVKDVASGRDLPTRSAGPSSASPPGCGTAAASTTAASIRRAKVRR